MKTIGIIGAMDEEILYIKDKMELVTAKNIVGTDFYIGKMFSKSVVLVRCGIGKVNAAICTQVLIDLYGVDYVINTGVAGAISKELNASDIVISTDLVHHDFDSSAFTDNLPGMIPRLEESYFKADKELISIAEEAAKGVLKHNKVLCGRIASGDQFIAKKEVISRIDGLFKPLCVEMEGAAIAQTCYLNKIPFVVIRAMSDGADGDAAKNYEKNKDSAALNSAFIVEALIEAI